MIVQTPEIKPSQAQFELVREDEALQMMSGREVVAVQRPARWAYTFSMIPQTDDQGRVWRQVLSRLSSLANSFRAPPPAYFGPSSGYLDGRFDTDVLLTLWDDSNIDLFDGSLLTVTSGWSSGGPPVVDGSGQLGRRLFVKGLANNELILRAGDYFTVQNELKIVTQDIYSTGSGGAEFVFEPALRNSPADETHVEIAWPHAVFRLLQPVGGWQHVPLFHLITINAVEAVMDPHAS
jgi:hypothetical protein